MILINKKMFFPVFTDAPRSYPPLTFPPFDPVNQEKPFDKTLAEVSLMTFEKSPGPMIRLRAR